MSTSVQSVGNLHQAATQLSPMAAATAPVTTPYPDVGRAVFQDPRTGQSVCCSPFDSRSATLLTPTVSRHGLHDVMYPTAEKGWLPFSHIDPSMIYPNALANGRTACYPYDLLPAQYPFYGESNYYGYGAMDLNGARRKNATRETTSTLKAWLYEHRKNPYPTKGEKIMLAIITKMTLTQVSTWFANARRRLKKDKKMTWSPRTGGCGSGDADGEDCDELELDDVGCDEKDDGIGSDLESSHNEQLSDTDDAHDGNRADWETRVSPRDAETTSIGSPRAEPNVSLGSNSGRDSFVNITQDSEEDSASRSSREHYSTVCHRRSPSPSPLAPSSVIRATCRPTSRSPPCEKVLPRQTEKPKIWSLAETALSKSPERSHRKPEHCRVTSGLHNRFSPYDSSLNHPRLASHHPTSVHVQLDDGTSSRTTGIISNVVSDYSRTFSHVGHGSHVFTGADAFSRLQHIKGNTVKTT